MHRVLVCSVVLLLATQVALTAEPSKKVSIAGELTGGMKVTASFTTSASGVTGGTGTLFGGTDRTGYAFTFTKVTTDTKTGSITLTGNFTAPGKFPITLTAKVPSGAQTFTYVVNGKTIKLAGQGTVTIK